MPFSQTLSFSNLPAISVGGLDYIEEFTAISGAAFANDPFTRKFISENDGRPADAEISLQRLIAHFSPLVKSGAESGAELVEAGGWKAVALWVPPVSVERPQGSEKNFRPALKEYKDKCQELQSKYLRGRKHWYLSIIGRDPKAMQPGAIRALIDPYLRRAQADGVPAWLEATNKHASEVYAHLGFKIAEVARLFEGKTNSSGEQEIGGRYRAVRNDI